MARIRSIHPGLASDEIYMSMSMAAKAAWPLLWTECDDSGVFEWKPIVLKARIFPADNLDFAEILAEFLRLDCVRTEEVGGKPYGYIRNFGRYQRPKNPSFRFDVSPAMAKYTSSKERSFGNPPPSIPHPSPSPTEKPPQRKEEGGRRDIEDNLPAQHSEPAALGAIGLEFDRVTAECTQAISPAPISDLTIGPMVELFRKYGKEKVIFQLVSESRRTRQRPVKTWKLWAEIVSEKLVDAHGVDPPKPQENGRKIDIGSMYPMPEDNLRRAVEKWRESPQSWAPQWGDPPNENAKIKRWLAENKLEIA